MLNVYSGQYLTKNVYLTLYFNSESTDAYTSVKVLLFLPTNKFPKFIEYELKRDKDSERLWIYEMQNVPLKFNDVIEYWIYAENSNVGFFDNNVVRVQGEWNFFFIIIEHFK